MQQSAAFKILKTRLKAVPSYSFNGEQLKKTSSGNPYQFLQHMSGGSHTAEDGDVAVDSGNSHNGINFVARLNQFQQMQQQHREHFRAQAQTRKNSTSVAK
ncbi:VAC14-like protein, partial [Trifolium medium]|nr:VAC14-like protein [Trifolium medium]